MNIPVNPLIDTPIVTAFAVLTVLIVWGFILMRIFRKKPKRRIAAILVMSLSVVGLIGTFIYGLHARDEWRLTSAATLEQDYGLIIEPEAVSDLLVREQEVSAVDKDGKMFLVHIEGDYLTDGVLVAEDASLSRP